MKLPHAGAAAACVLGLALALSPPSPAARAAEPSFDCGKVEADSIAGMVCTDDGLAALDRKMAAVYADATARATGAQRSELRAEQRGWIKGRDDCWKSDDKRACVEQAYVLRIAELQAAYALVPAAGHAVYVCDGQADKRVTAAFFQTEPPTAVAEFRGQTSLMFQQPAASGAKYQGRNETLWEHQGEALIGWGYGTAEMRCRVSR